MYILINRVKVKHVNLPGLLSSKASSLQQTLYNIHMIYSAMYYFKKLMPPYIDPP